MSKLIEIGALWLSQGSAKSIATGNLGGKGGARLVLLANDKRGNEKAPDWRLFVAPDERREGQRESREEYASAPPPSGPGESDNDSGIPFIALLPILAPALLGLLGVG